MDGHTQIILLSDSQQGYWGPAWSPDGTRLAFSITTSGIAGELYLASPDGSELMQLTNNGRTNYLPAWSSSGEVISFISQEGVFGSHRTGDWQIYIMDSDGSNQQPLSIPANGNAPVWSPDGLRIVFTSDRDGDDDIWVMNADGSNQVNLTQNAAWDDQPRWSPNGTSIAFTSDRDGTANIFVMNIDGSEAKNLTSDLTTGVGIPVWSPDGSYLIFHAVAATK
jgi:TolB protein